MRRLILRSFQSPGDILMLTAAVRDLHAAEPGKWQIDVRTSAPGLWEQNPLLTPLEERAAGVETLEMHYPLIHQSNQRPYHFLHGYTQYLEERLKVHIPVTRFQGDLYLSHRERTEPYQPADGLALPERYWVIIARGKYDFTAKWWNPASYQAVVDHFRGRIHFVQCGEAGHWHPPLEGVTNLVGQTSLREFVWLMHRAEGVVCPVTFAMHLAAAVPTHNGHPNRACVVLAGGREPPHWEAYPQHQFLHTIGQLDCCAMGGCWKSRCQPVGDGDEKDRRDRCERPIAVKSGLVIPQCQELIRPEDVIAAIERTLKGWEMSVSIKTVSHPERPRADSGPPSVVEPTLQKRRQVLIEFRHGLGDAVQLTAVLKHLRHYHPEWEVDVAALRGKHSAFHGLCRKVISLDDERVDRTQYRQVHSLDWHENRTSDARWPNTKVTRCLQEVFRLTPIPDLCRYSIQIADSARIAAAAYLESLCGPPRDDGKYRAVLIHYEGNTSGDRKNLPTEIVRTVCETVRECDSVPIILDWDRRSPLPDGKTIFCPGVDHPLWKGMGTGDAETLAALIQASRLMIGVDSGPLHVAGATTTATIGVWTQHHPVNYFDLAAHVEHLVPEQRGDHIRAVALNYFRQAYRSRTYRDLAVELPALVEGRLRGIEVERVAGERFRHRLQATAYAEGYYREHQRAGLDYLDFGEWQRQYGDWFVDALSLRAKRVLDVGCACGAILRGLGEAGAVVQGVDLNEHMIQLGRRQWPDMTPLLHVCDAVNLHLFSDGTWDAIHSTQVAEHWRPELVPFILRELRRVVVPQGLFFCCLDTEELFARQGRRIEDEDPTHICVKPMGWWHEQLNSAGWQVMTEEVTPALREHPASFLKQYDWDWFAARRAD